MASRGYLIAFVAPCGLMDEYVTDSLILPGDSQGQSIAGLGPLLVGEVPIVRLDSGVIGKAVRHQRGFAGLATTPHRLAVARTRSESSAGICELRLLGDSDSDLSAGGGSSTTHRTMPSTPMAEAWSQVLNGESPDPTWMDDAGNLYFGSGPRGRSMNGAPATIHRCREAR